MVEDFSVKNVFEPRFVKADNLADLWIKCLRIVMRFGVDYYVGYHYDIHTKDLPVIMFVTDPMKEPRVHPKAPLKKEALKDYVKNLIHGLPEQEENEFDYTYHSRLRWHWECAVREQLPNMLKNKEDVKNKVQEISGGKCVVRSFDQVKRAIELLKHDPTLRKVDLHTWMPLKDMMHPDKHQPCLQMIQARIHDGKLHFFTILKSNDLFNALPTNLYGFTSLQKYMADEVGVGVGSYTQFSISLHIYKDSFEIVNKILEEEGV